MHTGSTIRLFVLSYFQKEKRKNPSAKPGETKNKVYLSLAGMGEENKTVAISLLLVEGFQINKKRDRMRVVMQVINIFKALGFLWLELSAKGWSIVINHKQGPSVSRHLFSLLRLKRREGKKYLILQEHCRA